MTVGLRIRKLQRFFSNADNKFAAAQNHISRKFLNGKLWSRVKEDPRELPNSLLAEIDAYITRVLARGTLP